MKESKLYQEIMDEGRLEVQRAAILTVLRARFEQEPFADLKTLLDAITTATELNRLLQLAARCSRVDEFLNTLLHW